MADKEIRINVITEADASQLEDLRDQIEETKNLAESGISLDDMKSEFAEVTAEVERLQEELQFSEDYGFADDIEPLEEALAEATARAEELSDAINSIESSNVQETASEFDNVSDSAGNATSEVEGLQNSMSLLEAGALMSISSELGSLGSSAEGMAQEMNTAAITVGQLSTNVGVAEPQMVSLINNISNATFPQSEAMAYVGALNQMGVSADRLGDSATNMDRINDATGIGYQKTMQLTQGLQAVGISADNLPASFDAIAFAQANVNGGADTLSMVLKRQASTINEYGLNVDQLVVIMQALSAQGVQGMKMGSELSKVLKDNNGDVQAIEQSLGLQTGALSNASSATGEYAGKLQDLASEEAEHKTWLDQLGAAWEDVTLQMSPILDPMASFMGLIGQAGSWAVGVNGIIQLANSFRGLQLAEIASTIATKAAAAAQWLLNIAMDANPIMIVVLAIIALIAILGYLYFNNEQVRAAIDGLGQTFMYVGQIMYTSIINAVNWIISSLQGLWNYIITLGGLIPANVDLTGNQVINTILRVLAFIATLPIQLQIAFVNMLAKTLGFGNNFTQRLISSASQAVSGFLSYIQQLPGIVMGEFNRVLGLVNDFINSLPQRVWDMGQAIIDALKASLGIGSPGHMFYMFEGELKRIDNLPGDMQSSITKNVSKLGAGIVDNFNPRLDIGFNETGNADLINELSGSMGNQVFNLNIEVGTVDNEDRVQEIVDAVRRELSWNNQTAGRTI